MYRWKTNCKRTCVFLILLSFPTVSFPIKSTLPWNKSIKKVKRKEKILLPKPTIHLDFICAGRLLELNKKRADSFFLNLLYSLQLLQNFFFTLQSICSSIFYHHVSFCVLLFQMYFVLLVDRRTSYSITFRN